MPVLDDGSSVGARALPSAESRHERGTSTLQFALVLPIFALLIFGIIDYSRVIWASAVVAYGARDAARWASVRSGDARIPATPDSVRDRVRSKLMGLPAGDVEITTVWEPSNRRGGLVRVQLDYHYDPITPVLPLPSFDVSSRAERHIVH